MHRRESSLSLDPRSAVADAGIRQSLSRVSDDAPQLRQCGLHGVSSEVKIEIDGLIYDIRFEL